MVNNETRTVPKSSLAYLFPLGFNEFWTKTGIKPDLEQIIYDYVPATDTTEELRKTLASGGYGLLAQPIAKHYFDRYQFRTFEPYEDVFISTFKTNIINAIIEIRKKEYLWQKIYREVDKLAKERERTETQTHSGTDKINRNKQTTIKTERQAIMSTEIVDKETKSDSFNLGGWDQKGTKLTIKRKHNDLNAVSRLINNFLLTVIKLSDYYPLFDKLFIKFFGATVVPIICEKTGKRKWVSEAEYEEIITEETPKQKPLEGNEWDLSLPYLERVTIYRNKTDKEHEKMPSTSNRKPRIARRLEVLNGLVKAEEKLDKEEIVWATLQEFDNYCQTYIIGYKKFISIMRAQLASQLFYQGTGEKVPQGLYLLLGPPGIGKSYICQELAKAMKRGFHSIDMNGKRNGSLIFGSNIENPGAEIGEVIKAVGIVTQDPFAFIAFDEYEKSFDAAKSAVGDVTDMTKNKFFKDELIDFPYNLENITFFATGNYEWQVEGFIFSRFTQVEIEILTYEERIEILRRLLFGYREMKGKIQGLMNVLTKKGKITPQIKEYLESLNNEELIKKFLTKNWGIRQSKNNALLLVKRLNALFAEEKELPEDPINHNWGFTYSTEKGELCKELHEGEEERPNNCQCWDSSKVEGWEENMEFEPF